jgi:hypothetical protein
MYIKILRKTEVVDSLHKFWKEKQGKERKEEKKRKRKKENLTNWKYVKEGISG